MKIIISPDSFKGCLSATAVCRAIEIGILNVAPDTDIVKIPMSDGGEGVVDVLVAATGGRMIREYVKDPLGREIESFYGILGRGDTAVIEMAAASGLTLLSPDERNPLLSSTYGTGQLIHAAINKGIKKILVGIGGSATNDGGVGMAMALGTTFLQQDGSLIGPGGGEIGKIAGILTDQMHPGLRDVEILVACDVDNPLTGKNGASKIYGPQKGATPDMVNMLDQHLAHLAHLIRRDVGKEVDKIPGSGAAGGLGAGLIGFCNAQLKQGIDLMLDHTGFDEAVADADLVITGEGKMDHQTIFGKVPVGVALRAKKFNCPVIAINGSITDDLSPLHDKNILSYFSIVNSISSEAEIFKQTPKLLKITAEQVIRTARFGLEANHVRA